MATEGAQRYRGRPGQAARAGDGWKAAQVGWVKEAQGGGSKQRGQQYRKLTVRAAGDTGWSWVILVEGSRQDSVPASHWTVCLAATLCDCLGLCMYMCGCVRESFCGLISV